LVGVLDAFWESKGYVTAEEYHRFSCQTVPLARMAKRIWTNDESFIADIEIAHFGPADMEEATVIWTVAEAGGGQVESGVFAGQTIAVGNLNRTGNIKVPLGDIKSAAKLILTVSIKGTDFSNDWDFWVYPQSVDTAAGDDILLAEYLDDKALARLNNGGKVMLIPGPANIQGNVQLGFSSIFWNTAWTNNQPPHTLGILCDPGHPALADFPTEYHSNWQWWEIITNSSAMILDDFSPQLRPIVQVIDDWVTNRRLALVFEAEVNGGKLLVCSIDLENNLDKRPVARQFRHSLLKYMASADFAPVNSVNIEQLKTLFK
jgi:hypothetical protein